MSEYTKSTAQKQEGKTAPEKVGMFRMNGGKLEMLRTSEKKANELKQSGQPERLEAYFDAAFSAKPDGEQERLRRFMAVWNKTQCLLCSDLGVHNVSVTAPHGGVYDVAFACICELGETLPAGSIAEIVRTGAYDLKCQFGGDTGEFCPLQERKHKCWKVKCPKFGA